MANQATTRRWSRESRLLLLTVVVCATVLLVLARLRFPEPPRVEVSAPPLERLAARASYDALAADIQRVEPMIAPNLLVLRVRSGASVNPYDVWQALNGGARPDGLRHVVALRTGTDTAIAPMDASTHIDGIVGQSGTASVLGVDSVRGWARLRVPDADFQSIQQRTLASLATPLYVVILEGTQAGATLRPIFLGRGDRFTSVKWKMPLVPLGGLAVSPGAFLFSLDGALLGAVVVEGGAPAVAGARDLLDAFANLSTAGTIGDLGIRVQPLTPELARATGADRGVIVAEVDPDGAAASILEPGDVVTAIDDRPADSPDDLLVDIASRPVGESVTLTVVRMGEARTAMASVQAAAVEEPMTGLAFSREGRRGTRINAGDGEPVQGLRPGDLVIRAADVPAPSPAQLRRVLEGPSASGFAVLLIERDGRQRVVAVPAGGGGESGAAAR